jgi:hypothetical protein
MSATRGTANIARLGNIVEKIGTSQRILPQAVQQRFEVSSSGALVPPTEGSTKPVKSQGSRVSRLPKRFVALAPNGLQCIKVAHRAGGLTQNTVPLKEQKTCGSADLGTIAASARQSSRRDDLMDRLYDIEHRVQTTRALATIRSRFRGRYRAPNLQGVRSRLAGWRRFPECAGR